MASKSPETLVTDAVPLCPVMAALSVNSSLTSNSVSGRLANAGSCSSDSTFSECRSEETLIGNSSCSSSCGQSHFSRNSSDMSTAQFAQINNISHGSSHQRLLGSASTLTEVPSCCQSSNCCSTFNTVPRNSSSADDPGSTMSLNNSTVPYDFLESNESEIMWLRINRYLKFDVGGIPNENLWKKIAMALYGNIETWEQKTLENYSSPNYDFCVIHTKDEIDLEIVGAFMNILDLEGLEGVSLSNFRVGDDKFEASAKILNGSTVIFALDSLPFSQSGFHRLQFQESMIKAIKFQDWKKKLIPLRLSKTDLLRYKEKYPLLWYKSKGSSLFGLSSTEGILLGKRGYVIEKVRQVLTIDHQEINKEQRLRRRRLFEHSIQLAKESKCRNLREGLVELRRQFERDNYSPESLVRLCLECEELPSFSSDTDESQIITLDNCTEISIGPSFHFNIYRSNEDNN